MARIDGIAVPSAIYTEPTCLGDDVETHGPLGVIWAGAGLTAFYIALIWINSLLGLFLTPLFLIPITWFVGGQKRKGSPTKS